MVRICLATAAALLTFTSTAHAGTQPASVVGSAEVDTDTVPVTTFDIRLHAHGDGRSGNGVIWLTHHDDTRIAWAVARVDCVRRQGATVVVTGVVGDAQDFAVAGPGDPVSVTVRDGDPDLVGLASREQVTRCHGPRPTSPVTRGDFRLG